MIEIIYKNLLISVIITYYYYRIIASHIALRTEHSAHTYIPPPPPPPPRSETGREVPVVSVRSLRIRCNTQHEDTANTRRGRGAHGLPYQFYVYVNVNILLQIYRLQKYTVEHRTQDATRSRKPHHRDRDDDAHTAHCSLYKIRLHCTIELKYGTSDTTSPHGMA